MAVTDEELTRLLDELESDRVERKESAADGEKIRQAICAFANDLPAHGEPGVLFIGVSDAGEPTGSPVTDQLLRTLASMRDDGNIVPFPAMTVQKRTLKGADVAVVLVAPADAPPVRYKGRIHVRVGPRRALASPDEERRLSEKRRHRDQPYDLRPFPSATLEDLDEVVFRRVYLPAAQALDVIDENSRDLELQLMAARFAQPGPPPSPTFLGLLTVGRTPTQWLPNAYIEFLRIDGIELGDAPKDEREVRGPLPLMMQELDQVLRAHISSAVDFTTADLEQRRPDYPLVALQQIARNAVLHRSYEHTHAPVRIYWFDDRVEVLSPGGPFGVVNRSNFGQPGAYDYRNPNLAAVMKELGYVQRFGFGIVTARRQMEGNGNPPIEFQVEDTYVNAILRARP